MTSSPLPLFQLPLQNVPSPEYLGRAHPVSLPSVTDAFETGIDERDTFLGEKCCVVCGSSLSLNHCHIIPKSEEDTWTDLRNRGWITAQAKHRPQHDPRNGLLMCANHHVAFSAYMFFIRYIPFARKFVLVNHSGHRNLTPHHGKAIALDITHRYAPFPSLFIIHEMRVRGHNPFVPEITTLPNDCSWQDWILSSGVLQSDPTQGFFNRAAPSIAAQPQLPPQNPTNTGDIPPNAHILGLSDDLIAEILAATRASASWKACQVEGTSWTGTAEENIQKYMSEIGADDSDRLDQ